MDYKEAIKRSMEILAQDERRIFLGYNVAFGSRGYGTFNDVAREKLLETPLAENLMIDLGIGMSLEGFRPVIFFERHDFMLNASDAIVNHADKLEELSRGQYKTPIIIRATIGASKPLNPGPQHTQDFTEAFRNLIKFPIYSPRNSIEIFEAYKLASETNGPIMVVEKKDWYNRE